MMRPAIVLNRTVLIPILLAVALLAAAGGFLAARWAAQADAGAAQAGPYVGHAHEASEGQAIWTCSMHPQIRQSAPGKCPICFMDLVPVIASQADLGPRVFQTSEAGQALMDIRTYPAERRFVAADIRMVGKVDFDETRQSYIAAWVPGRLDRLYVDYTGVAVRQGDHMVELYSPDLLTAQQELLQAVRASVGTQASQYDLVRQSTQRTVESAREKLRLLGLTAEQIAQIESTGEVSDHVTIYAPVGGIVIEKLKRQGDYVQTGERIYTIADLSRVWVRLHAYESDLPWLRYGQRVTFTTVAYPGRTFEGRVSFINPVLDERTRTVNVRVTVDNAQGLLKPAMLVRAEVHPTIGEDGQVLDADLAGKWISPMHPEIVKDGPGTCDVCGMPLVKAETLGYVSADAAEAQPPLVIPATAPLITGKRAVVYVEVPATDRPTYEGREVILGPRAGAWYIVEEGLQEGERVVTNGAFKIDSSLQIQARPSMMSPDGGAPGGHAHGGPAPGPQPEAAAPMAAAPQRLEAPPAFHEQLAALYDAYLAAAAALAADDAPAAQATARQAREALAAIDVSLLDGPVHERWMAHQRELSAAIDAMASATTLEQLRAGLDTFTQALSGPIETFGLHDRAAFRVHCPMAFDNRGAFWLQANEDIRNPYFGQMMLKCFDTIEPIAQPVGHADGRTHDR